MNSSTVLKYSKQLFLLIILLSSFDAYALKKIEIQFENNSLNTKLSYSIRAVSSEKSYNDKENSIIKDSIVTSSMNNSIKFITYFNSEGTRKFNLDGNIGTKSNKFTTVDHIISTYLNEIIILQVEVTIHDAREGVSTRVLDTNTIEFSKPANDIFVLAQITKDNQIILSENTWNFDCIIL